MNVTPPPPYARKRILVASSDLATCELVRSTLAQAKHNVAQVDSLTDAITGIETESYDLVILDVTLAYPNGFALCAQLRLLSNVPVLLLNAHRDIDLLIYGFEMGADDYMLKPLDPRELTARIAALLRRADPLTSSYRRGQITIHDLCIDLDSRIAFLGGQRLELTPTEFTLLTFLASRPGYAFSRHTLFRSVWGGEYVGSTNVVDVCIRRLRKKLEQNGVQHDYILTVRGIGYSMCRVT